MGENSAMRSACWEQGSQGWRPGAPVPNLPRLGLQAVPPPPQQRAGVGGRCWGIMLTKHQEEASSGQQEARSAPAHLPKVHICPSQQGGSGRWEGQTQKWLPGTRAARLYSKCRAGRAGFPRGRGIFNFFPSQVLRKSASATGQLSLEPQSG